MKFLKNIKEKNLHLSKMLTLVCMVFLAVIVLPASLNATTLNVDEIIYQDIDAYTNPDLLAGTVDMTFDSALSKLMIVLTNTSSPGASTEAAQNLLTGLGFNLPGTLYIDSGSVSMEGSTAVNFTAPSDNDVSGEWGYDNNPLNSGPFQTVPEGQAYSTVNTVVSSMMSSTKDGKFSPDSIADPENLDGPEFGLLSNSVDDSVAGGLNAIKNSITLDLILGGDWSGTDLIGFINSNDVVLSFGSPNISAVPEPATMLLLGSGLIGLAGFRRKFRKK